jgi:GntR family transcriptional regulator/MocR family aminotransferase
MSFADTPTSTRSGAILMVRVDRASATPLAEQIYGSIKTAIEAGRLRAGAPLPSSRALARDLGVARSTIILAFEHLRKEGFVDGRLGRVNCVRRGAVLSRPPVHRLKRAATAPPLSARAARMAALPPEWFRDYTDTPRAFRTGVPALDLFPVGIWQKVLASAWRRSTPRSLGYGDPHGYKPLRRAIGEYLRSARGLQCHEDQILICAGSQQAIQLCAQLLFDPGDAAWMEEPGYTIARYALSMNGARVVPVPVDAQGLDVRAGVAAAPEARVAYVTPAKQLPLGVTMSPSRREELLAWANAADAYVIEDDYDSELRYATSPPAPLATLDAHGRVIFIGTLSKILYPSLRVGYMVVPPPLVEIFRRARVLTDFSSPALVQAALTEFITAGHFERHIRRMRTVYHRRQQLLLHGLKTRLGPRIEFAYTDAGMNLVMWLPRHLDDRRVAAEGAAHGLDLTTLSAFAMSPQQRPGLLLGFGGIPDQEIIEGVARLERLLRQVSNGVAS